MEQIYRSGHYDWRLLSDYELSPFSCRSFYLLVLDFRWAFRIIGKALKKKITNLPCSFSFLTPFKIVIDLVCCFNNDLLKTFYYGNFKLYSKVDQWTLSTHPLTLLTMTLIFLRSYCVATAWNFCIWFNKHLFFNSTNM